MICFYFRNIHYSYSEISYIRKKELRCEKGKQMEIPFLFWIQFVIKLQHHYGFSRYSLNGSSTHPRQSYCILHSFRIVCIRGVSNMRTILVKYNSNRTKLPDLKPAFLQFCTFTYFQITIAFVLGNPYSLEIGV